MNKLARETLAALIPVAALILAATLLAWVATSDAAEVDTTGLDQAGAQDWIDAHQRCKPHMLEALEETGDAAVSSAIYYSCISHVYDIKAEKAMEQQKEEVYF